MITKKILSALAVLAMTATAVLVACTGSNDHGRRGQGLGSGSDGEECLECQCGNCGNGMLDPEEQCDDGNHEGGDGCDASCEVEGCGNGMIDVGGAGGT